MNVDMHVDKDMDKKTVVLFLRTWPTWTKELRKEMKGRFRNPLAPLQKRHYALVAPDQWGIPGYGVAKGVLTCVSEPASCLYSLRTEPLLD